MFNFLRDKLKSAISKIGGKIKEEGKDEEVEIEIPAEKVEKPEQKKGFFSRITEGIAKKKEEPTEKTQQDQKIVEKPGTDLTRETHEAHKEKKSVVSESKQVEVKSVKVETEKPVKVHEEKPHEEQPESKKIEKTEKRQEIAPSKITIVKTEPEKKRETPPKVQQVHQKSVEREERPAQSRVSIPEKKVEPPKVEVHHPQTEQTVEKKAETELEDAKTVSHVHEGAEQAGKKIETEGFYPEQKGFFARIKEKVLAKRISEQQFEQLFEEMEFMLLENNVAVEVIDKIKQDLKNQIVEKPIRRNKVEEVIMETLRSSIEGLFEAKGVDLIKAIKTKKNKPYVICFIGINGSGKTTTIAKMGHMLQNKNVTSVIAAADTFRAAAIDQLDYHGEKLGIKVIKHQYGSDPAAVVFDAIKHAQAKGIDTVLIDTAGRLHSNTNLMDELRKIVRIAKPDLKIFVGESITGNDCIEQAKQFNDAIGIDEIVLSKADVDEKGGTAISISYVTRKPISYIGVGQGYDDIEIFSSEKIIDQLGLAQD
jgi:fused signal recognition particle receptor